MLEFIDQQVIPFFLALYDAIGYLGVAVGVALETFVPILPSEVMVPMAGWKIAQSGDGPVVEWLTDQPWTFVGVMVAATIGAALGSLAGYLIGAWGGRPLLDRYGRYIHIYPDDLDRADAWFARYGGLAVFLARFVPLLRALINYPAGVARMPIGRFLLYSILGSIPWNLALVTAGWVLGENYEALYEAIRPFELVIYVIVVVGIGVVLFRWARGRAAPRQV